MKGQNVLDPKSKKKDASWAAMNSKFHYHLIAVTFKLNGNSSAEWQLQKRCSSF